MTKKIIVSDPDDEVNHIYDGDSEAPVEEPEIAEVYDQY